jgi:outer membrane immunogenic protein
MNKKLLVLLLSVVSTTAMAGNDFTGPYAGISLGYASGDDDGKEYDAGVFDDYTQSTEPRGGLLGVFAGYNWALANNMIIGIEGDYDARNADDSNFQKFMGIPDTGYTAKTDVKAAASLRGRLGYLFNNNMTMAYVTGGYATARIKRTFTDVEASFSQSSTNWQDGWTAGIGLEHAVMDKWSVRAEYRYADYGNKTVSTDLVYGPTYTEKQDYDEDSIRISASYSF